MGSRRITTRSFSGNGRSITGDDLNGSSRPGACSYLSNVRPENRSTLCSVIAQLTEETQPSFETTLKSRAISENCNVKFSCVVTGHPTPQVIWYKDDVQLDRYCGLPKYEIFRNGQTHSLHIYNCTVEDAAIYQASASNSKGIVSCSGVLEVGEMNEFKIHQRYFGKIKQKAEHRRREAEGKENLEPLRTISPERTQRKRRSTMEDFLSTPSSMEDEGNEGSSHNVAVETDTRLQDVAVDNVEEKLLPIANAPTSAVTNGVVHDNANKNGAYIHDSAQKVFTAHQPKTPSVKKKIKISSSAKAAKADTPGERVSEERSLKVGNSASVARTGTESAQSRGKSEELMEVENIVSASVVESNSRNMTKQCQKSATVETTLRNRPSKEENVCVAPSQKEQLTAPPAVSPAALTSTRRTVSGTEGKQAARHEKRVGHKVTEDKVDIRNHGPYSVTQQPKSSTLPTTLKEDVTKTEDVAVIDVDEKQDSSTGGSLLHLDSAEMPYESRTALPQRPCEQAGDQLSQKEISQKNVSVSRPARPGEFAQARTKNDAPVSLELPYNWRMIDTQQPQKTPSASDITRDDTETLSLNSGLYAPIDKTTQDTWHHSRGSSESYTVLADLQKSPLNTQADTAVRSVDGTEIQVDEKLESIEVGKLLAQDDRVAPNEKTVEMETESPALQNVELKKEKGTEKCETISKMAEEKSFELQNVKPDKLEPAMPHLTNNLESTNELEQIIDFKEISKPVSKVISIAELLRAQLKALDSTLGNSVPFIPIQADFVQEPSTTGTDTCQELKENDRKCDTQGKKAMPDRKMETMTDDAPPTNIKVTLMEIYHQLNTDSSTEQVQTQGPSSSPVQALQEPRVISPVTVPEATVLHSCDTKYSESVMDVGKEAEASTPVPLIDYPVVSLTEREKVGLNFHPLTSKDELTVCPTKPSRQTSNIVLEHVKDEPVQLKDIEFVKKLMPEIKLNGKTERVVTEMNSTTHLDQYKVEEHNAKSCSVHSGEKLPTESVKDNHQLLQQDSSMVEELSANPTPETSPSFRKRNCASPIPSATPQELASGARRKIVIPKAKPEEATEATSPAENQSQKTLSSKLSTSPVNLSTSPGLSRRSPLLQPPGEQTSPIERRSPLFSRRKTALETQAPNQQPTEEVHTPKTEGKPAEKNKHDPFKAPQVIRKIRSETFADTLGHLKVWCQFFNVLSDSTVKWYKNEEEVAQIKRNAGDETQVNLAIVQASSKDSGVYRCSITNEYGTDSTDLLLSTEILAGMSLREDLGVGEEIEMTPLIFTKGVADSGVWGNRLFGRIMMQESHIGDGCSHKVWRAKVIYGLEPVFESGNTCIIKVRNPITYGGKGESCLIDRNLELVKQECKIQNLAREYCKIFSAEARAIENFGPCLEVIPVYLMYRPANTVPYSTVEADLTGVYQKYSSLDHTGRIDTRTGSVVEQKCCTLQHWIFQWTNGNLLLTRLEGVDTKITNVGISVKSTGHQALSVEGNPKVFEQFVAQHQCNYFCGLLGLRSLKVMDSLSTPVKPKASRSPLLQRKMAAGSSSPQTGRKAAGSPRVPRKAEQEGRKTPTKQKATDAPKNT